ncbi:MAG: hypothetical protein ABIH00_03130 [Armatimonadota bacterium]
MNTINPVNFGNFIKDLLQDTKDSKNPVEEAGRSGVERVESQNLRDILFEAVWLKDRAGLEGKDKYGFSCKTEKTTLSGKEYDIYTIVKTKTIGKEIFKQKISYHIKTGFLKAEFFRKTFEEYCIKNGKTIPLCGYEIYQRGTAQTENFMAEEGEEPFVDFKIQRKESKENLVYRTIYFRDGEFCEKFREKFYKQTRLSPGGLPPGGRK